MTRVGIITQARTTSTRLPRKVLLPIGGRTVLDHHLDRLVRSGLPVLVATTTNETDDEIEALASGRGLAVHRGSESDVLSRFAECAAEHSLDVVVRVTSDCPLIDGALIADAVREWIAAEDPRLYLSNTVTRTFPRGFDFEVFSGEALAEADAQATSPAEREHVTPWMYAEPADRFHVRGLSWPSDKSSYRITLDTTEDLELVRRLVEEHHAESLSCAEIIGVLDAHPELAEINRHVEQKKLGD
jgi:spore coat polysaccharide biosynthesis protein SpsF